MAKIDFSDPRDREAFLKSVEPTREAVKPIHRELLEVFKREMEYREGSGELDYFEQLYCSALLLYLIGDPADVPLMWQAKHINMDTGSGFDGQFFVGAGVDATIDYLDRSGAVEISGYIRKMKECGEVDDLESWEKFRIGYFYPNRKA
jgi:hypothetical protein